MLRKVGPRNLTSGLALTGALLHMVNHSMLKLCLFCAAGVVVMNIHALDLNRIRGFGRKKPLLKIQFLMGALGIGGIPLWNGYISKTLIHESIVEYRELLEEGVKVPLLYGEGIITLIEWIFIFSGGITIAYMTKLFVALFVEKNADESRQVMFDEKKNYMNGLSAIVISLPALFMPLAGMLPHLICDGIMESGRLFLRAQALENVHFFSLTNLTGALYSVAIGAFLYLVVVRKCLMKDGEYVNRWPKYLDLEEYFYRPLLLVILPAVCGFVCRILDRLVDTLTPVLLLGSTVVCRFADRFVDGIVVTLRKTVFKEERLPQERIEGSTATHAIGGWLDRTIHVLNDTVWEYRPRKENAEHRLAMLHMKISENNAIIARSLSFALSLAGVGLILILIYMLI